MYVHKKNKKINTTLALASRRIQHRQKHCSYARVQCGMFLFTARVQYGMFLFTASVHYGN